MRPDPVVVLAELLDGAEKVRGGLLMNGLKPVFSDFIGCLPRKVVPGA
jgi:hypothetical protein